MQVLSLGGGVQSTTLFLMNIHGEIDPPADFAVFADTGWERTGTYENIRALNTIALERGFPPVWKVGIGNIRAGGKDGKWFSDEQYVLEKNPEILCKLLAGSQIEL